MWLKCYVQAALAAGTCNAQGVHNFGGVVAIVIKNKGIVDLTFKFKTSFYTFKAIKCCGNRGKWNATFKGYCRCSKRILCVVYAGHVNDQCAQCGANALMCIGGTVVLDYFYQRIGWCKFCNDALYIGKLREAIARGA